MTKDDKPRGESEDRRKSRLAEKLRENLRRRKVQMRERREADAAAMEAPESASPDRRRSSS